MARSRRSPRSRPPIKNPWFAWLWDTSERGLRMYAGCLATVIGGDYVMDSWSATWQEAVAAAFFGFAAEVVFSLAGKRRGADDSASLLSREQDPPLGD